MRKLLWLFLITPLYAADYTMPSNSVSLSVGTDNAQTIISVSSPIPGGSYGATLFSGNVPWNSGLDQYIEPIWVVGSGSASVTVSRGTVATVNAQRTWTINSPKQGLIKTHAISSEPQILYYVATMVSTPTATISPTITNTPSFTMTATPWPTMAVNVGNIPGSALTIWNLNGGSGDESVSLSGTPGPLAVTTPGGKAVVVSDLNIPGNLSIGGYISSWLSADDISTSNIVDGSGLNLVGNSGTGPTLGNALENTLINGLSVSFGMNPVRGVPTPAYADSSANKTYVDNYSAGMTATGDTAIYTYAGVTILNVINGIAVTNR